MGKKRPGRRRNIYKAKNENIHSNQIKEDDNVVDYISPHYPPHYLITVVEQSDILKPLISAYATNIALFGAGVKYNNEFDYNKADEATKKEAEKEWVQLENFIKYFNAKESIEKILYKAICDKETIAYGAIEILRRQDGRICGGEHIPSYNIRIVPQNPSDRVTYIEKVIKDEDGKEMIDTFPVMFKKFVQLGTGNVDRVYFKEFGDKRIMDYRTGEYVTQTDYPATEILFISNYCSYSEYGVPKWTGNTMNILGSNSASKLNLKFFEKGKITPLAVIVNGGQLTDDTVENIRSGEGLKNPYGILLLEGLPPDNINELDSDKEKVDIKVQPIAETIQKDALFTEYQKDTRNKVRADFRLPPIFTGESSDYTRSTAEVAKLIAEEQVFIPERNDIANMFNIILQNEFNFKYVEMYLKGNNTGNLEEFANAIKPFIQSGTCTPNMLIDKLGEVLGKDLEELPSEFGDVPIEILKLNIEESKATGNTSETEIQKAYTIDLLGDLENIISKYIED